ncbi:SURF1 family-domain-containing protein [Powellomyces hirtus]|nr:SURF1 family-domain-containing protein [Powellomyces hirtus]
MSSALGGWLWAVPIGTFGLGCWQVYRLQWKLDLIEKADQRMHLDPVPLPATDGLVSNIADEYRRVHVTGAFLHDKEMLLGPRTRNDQEQQGGGLIGGGSAVGFYVITPFQRSDEGRIILVNRGWIPRSLRDQSKRKGGLIEGPVKIEGLMRTAEKSSMLRVVENRPEKNEWYWLDMAAMTEHSGARPLLIEMIGDSAINAANSGDEFPIPRNAHINFRNTHIQYAITWYGLSLFSTFAMWKSHRRMPRGRPLR